MAEQTETTARDLMTPNPVSIHGHADIPEVLAFLTDTGFSAAPVIDEAGRPVGVVSRTDVVVYERATAAPPAESAATVRAADLMTPVVFAVPPGTSAREVAREMVRQNVRAKWEGHEINTARFVKPQRTMHAIGG